MSKADAVRAVAKLIAAFRANVKPETVEIYAEHLATVSPERLETAVRDLIDTSKFFPTVAEIRQVVRSLPVNPKPFGLIGPAVDDRPLPMCEECGKHWGFQERDGKKVCLWCMGGPGAGVKPADMA